jgi:superfamily II DNA or RNA helicase
MRQRKASVTISTSIFDEGIDCRPLDTLILAGAGKSQTRALQRVGRVLRPYSGKNDAIVIDIEDHCKHLFSHSKKRRKIYSTEPEFDIETLDIT